MEFYSKERAKTLAQYKKCVDSINIEIKHRTIDIKNLKYTKKLIKKINKEIKNGIKNNQDEAVYWCTLNSICINRVLDFFKTLKYNICFDYFEHSADFEKFGCFRIRWDK